MVLRSQNGYSANDRSFIASYSLPGGRVALRKGDPSVVLLWCANRWHETVEPLVWPGVWGYAERTIRGNSTTLSNHASGTALDLNAPQHPMGTDPERNFSADEIDAVHAIVEFCEGTVRWGGDYRHRKDGMHLELVESGDALRRVADKIREAERRKKIELKPTPRPRRTDAVLIKTQPDKSKAEYLTALLSGPMFVGLGPTETPSDEQAREMGLPVLWVEYGTYQEFDQRSHALCDNPRPVVTQSPVVTKPAPATREPTREPEPRPAEQRTFTAPNAPGPSSK